MRGLLVVCTTYFQTTGYTDLTIANTPAARLPGLPPRLRTGGTSHRTPPLPIYRSGLSRTQLVLIFPGRYGRMGYW